MEIITNPSVPFWCHIPGGVEIGTVIKIDGHVPHHYDRFAINLMCGHDMSEHAEHHSSIALHISPRHFEQYVVLNWRHHKQWSEDEQKHHQWQAFQRGHNFSVSIHVDPEYYRINVNGIHFVNFYHRIPVNEVQSLLIDGDVHLYFIEYKREDNIFVESYSPESVYFVPE